MRNYPGLLKQLVLSYMYPSLRYWSKEQSHGSIGVRNGATMCAWFHYGTLSVLVGGATVFDER